MSPTTEATEWYPESTVLSEWRDDVEPYDERHWGRSEVSDDVVFLGVQIVMFAMLKQ